ncbi:MAG TPA: ubiquinol-cytochrome c reductase iron-sulfur subunit [Candidatus Polarisedimenticolia bacterium]|jgi:cytochrome b6-f complex iron-sulfur subunit|nr:ubiquinol-cytochrome c reductase iron-sulfur subunit [Candidatus Polarisedimenticolia bacterium]
MPDAPKTEPVVLPASPGAAAGGEVSRRGFLSWIAIAWVSFTGAMTLISVSTLRFFFPNVLFEPPQTFKAGFPSEYAPGVDNRFKESRGVFMVRDDKEIYALSTVCTHLGCTPNWLDAEGKFKCPCHGSGFYITGINFEGPAPRPLERFRIVLAEDGQILVDKTKVYRQEKGQWQDPEAFIPV